MREALCSLRVCRVKPLLRQGSQRSFHRSIKNKLLSRSKNQNRPTVERYKNYQLCTTKCYFKKSISEILKFLPLRSYVNCSRSYFSPPPKRVTKINDFLLVLESSSLRWIRAPWKPQSRKTISTQKIRSILLSLQNTKVTPDLYFYLEDPCFRSIQNDRPIVQMTTSDGSLMFHVLIAEIKYHLIEDGSFYLEFEPEVWGQDL